MIKHASLYNRSDTKYLEDMMRLLLPLGWEAPSQKPPLLFLLTVFQFEFMFIYSHSDLIFFTSQSQLVIVLKKPHTHCSLPWKYVMTLRKFTCHIGTLPLNVWPAYNLFISQSVTPRLQHKDETVVVLLHNLSPPIRSLYTVKMKCKFAWNRPSMLSASQSKVLLLLFLLISVLPSADAVINAHRNHQFHLKLVTQHTIYVHCCNNLACRVCDV